MIMDLKLLLLVTFGYNDQEEYFYKKNIINSLKK